MDKITVLLAEDELALAHIVRESLEQGDFKVILCSNGEQAYQQYQRTKARYFGAGCDDAKNGRI